jgi:hypothetical protein
MLARKTASQNAPARHRRVGSGRSRGRGAAAESQFLLKNQLENRAAQRAGGARNKAKKGG